MLLSSTCWSKKIRLVALIMLVPARPSHSAIVAICEGVYMCCCIRHSGLKRCTQAWGECSLHRGLLWLVLLVLMDGRTGAVLGGRSEHIGDGCVGPSGLAHRMHLSGPVGGAVVCCIPAVCCGWLTTEGGTFQLRLTEVGMSVSVCSRSAL